MSRLSDEEPSRLAHGIETKAFYAKEATTVTHYSTTEFLPIAQGEGCPWFTCNGIPGIRLQPYAEGRINTDSRPRLGLTNTKGFMRGISRTPYTLGLPEVEGSPGGKVKGLG